MSATETLTAVEYPESDGQPMGETQLHRNWMIRLTDLLEFRYQNERAYVGSDLLMYYVEGDPKKFAVPDVFLVKDSRRDMRDTFKVWEEERVPTVIFEVTSKSTRARDERDKPALYASLGVPELILFDPRQEYLKPPLQLFELAHGEYVRQEPDTDGRLYSSELDVFLFLEDRQLVLLDRATRTPLQTEFEATAQRLEAEASRAKAETSRAESESRRAESESRRAEAEASRAEAESERADAEAKARAILEAEVEKLRDLMRKQGLSE